RAPSERMPGGRPPENPPGVMVGTESASGPRPHTCLPVREHRGARETTSSGGEPVIKVLLLDVDGVLRIWDPQFTDTVEATYGLPPGALVTAARSPERLEDVLTGLMDDQAWRDSVAEDIARAHGEHTRPAFEEWLRPPGEVDTDAL